MMHYQQVIKNALAKGYSINVFDGEEWQVKREDRRNERAIIDAAQSVDMATLRIRDENGEHVGDVEIKGYYTKAEATADGYDDSVVDYSDNAATTALIEDI